mgnify:CR=1 FL=1
MSSFAVTIAALIFTQMGFATAYVIFISTNLSTLYSALSMRAYCGVLLPPLIAVCFIRQMWLLNPLALAGMFAIALAVGTVLYYCIEVRKKK